CLSHLQTTHKSPLFPYTTLFRSEIPVTKGDRRAGWPCRHSSFRRGRPRQRRRHRGRFAMQTFGQIAEQSVKDRNNEKREEGACQDRKSTRLNSSHVSISYAVFCL